MRQHSPDLIEITWAVLGGIPIDLKSGLATGAFVVPTRNAETWTQRPNGSGGILRRYNPDRSGFLTVLIDASSRAHQELITLGNSDVLTRSLTGPVVMVDGNTALESTYSKAYIATIPDIPRGTASAVIPWRFNFETFFEQPLDFERNRVGS